MAIMIQFSCDQPVPYGICADMKWVVAPEVAVAVEELDRSGRWYIGKPDTDGRRRVLCPLHSGAKP